MKRLGSSHVAARRPARQEVVECHEELNGVGNSCHERELEHWSGEGQRLYAALLVHAEPSREDAGLAMMHLVRTTLFKNCIVFITVSFFFFVMLKLLSPSGRSTFAVKPLLNLSSLPILTPKPTKCFRSLRCSAERH